MSINNSWKSVYYQLLICFSEEKQTCFQRASFVGLLCLLMNVNRDLVFCFSSWHVVYLIILPLVTMKQQCNANNSNKVLSPIYYISSLCCIHGLSFYFVMSVFAEFLFLRKHFFVAKGSIVSMFQRVWIIDETKSYPIFKRIALDSKGMFG